jgi:hypothetical protein
VPEKPGLGGGSGRDREQRREPDEADGQERPEHRIAEPSEHVVLLVIPWKRKRGSAYLRPY